MTMSATAAETAHHLIGLLLGTENDWPQAMEALVATVGPIRDGRGVEHTLGTKRILIAPFSLRGEPAYDLVVDRLAHWYYVPREWLKKVALMDDTYLLNSPFTFQSMEKHAAYCAMMRLGLKVPETVLVPYKNPVDDARWAYTAERYNRSFDLPQIAEELGYPLYMKPFDGSGWRGVSRIDDRESLMRAYDESGEMLMHLQVAKDYDVFARALSIGPETIVMRYDPSKPQHDRYQVDHGFLPPGPGAECTTISRVVNAFFRWDFNSCEMLVKFTGDGDEVYPIDYANACPDVSITSLHYYFPWAIKALVKWCAYVVITEREARIEPGNREYFDIADREGLSYEEKLHLYGELAESHFDTERYFDWCDSRLAHFDEAALEWFAGPEFDALLVDTVVATFPHHEHDTFIAHYRGLLAAWCADESRRLNAG